MSDADTAVSKLRLEVESTEVEKATKNLDLMSLAGYAVVTVVGLIGTAVGSMAYKLYEGSVASSKLKSELASTGMEAGKVQKAFNDLVMISPNVNGGVQAATKSFRDLVANGLNPSEAAMMAYQDHAAHFGGDLETYVSKLVSVTNGQLNAMRQFGINVRQENDKLVVSFQGQKTVIENSTRALESYLMKLSQTKFKGAQAARDSNVGDILGDIREQWDLLWINIANQTGADNLFVEVFSMALVEAQKFNDLLASGEMEHNLRAIGNALAPLADIARGNFRGMRDSYVMELAAITAASQVTHDNLHSIWLDLPTGAKAAIERIIEDMSTFLVRMKYIAGAMKDDFLIEFGIIRDKAKAIAKDIADTFAHPLSGHSGLEQAFKDIDNKAATERKSNLEVFDQKMALLTKYNQAAHQRITDERNGTVKSIQDEYDAADKARKEYLKKQGSGTALSGFADGPGRKIESGSRNNQDAKDKKEYETLVTSLQNQEERIRASYDKRLGLIKKYTEEGSLTQADLSGRLVDQTANELAQISALRSNDLGSYFKSLKDAESLLKDSYEERKNIILNTTGVTEEQRNQMMNAAGNNYIAQQRAINAKRNDAALKGVQDFFHNVSSIGAAFGERGFKIAKAAAIASATIDMYQSAVGAYSAVARIPYIGPYVAPVAAAAAVAAGAANIANIKSQSYSGAYDIGGQIPSGKFGLVGERGPELVQGPAIVTGRNTTSGNGSLNGGSSPAVTVQIYNLPGQSATVTETESSSGERQLQVIIQKLEDKLTKDVRAGTGTMVPAMVRQFGLTRRPA